MDVNLEDLAQYVANARDLESLTRPMLELLERVSGLESTYLTAIDEAEGVQSIVYSHCSERLVIPEGLSVPWGDTLCRRALTEGTTFTNNVSERWGDSEAARLLGITTYLSQPVKSQDGTLVGTLCAASSLRREVSQATINVVSLFAGIIGQQIDREAMFAKLIESNTSLLNSASIDPLTGVANRRALHDGLRKMLRAAQPSGKKVCVAFIDLDGFKQINDTYGHDTGDRFLIDMTLRLLQAVRRNDLVARYGGDEFVVAAATDDAEELKQRLTAATQGAIHLGEIHFDYAGPSIGVVVADDDESDTNTLLERADRAMYEVKQHRRRR
ncbi:GGDEF domain-containing protein [Spongiibacter taiwanensis]